MGQFASTGKRKIALLLGAAAWWLYRFRPLEPSPTEPA